MTRTSDSASIIAFLMNYLMIHMMSVVMALCWFILYIGGNLSKNLKFTSVLPSILCAVLSILSLFVCSSLLHILRVVYSKLYYIHSGHLSVLCHKLEHVSGSEHLTS